MAEQITPPVDPAALEAAVAQEAPKALSLAQKIVRAEKAPVAAALLQGSVLLTSYLGMHLTAGQIAILGSIEASGLAYFLSAHFKSKAKA